MGSEAEKLDIVEVMESNRAERASHDDDVVVMISNARQRKYEKARKAAEDAARKIMEEAEERHDKKCNDPDVFVKLLMDRPVKVQVINQPEQKSSYGIETFIGALFTGLFAGVAAVLVALLITGIL